MLANTFCHAAAALELRAVSILVVGRERGLHGCLDARVCLLVEGVVLGHALHLGGRRSLLLFLFICDLHNVGLAKGACWLLKADQGDLRFTLELEL